MLPKSPTGQAIGYLLPRWDGLTRYCENGALSIDNNLSERMVRPCVIGRNKWMFLGSDNGGKAAAILDSITPSAKVNQVEPFAYVRDLLVQFSGRRPGDSPELLSDEWLRSHPEARCRCGAPAKGVADVPDRQEERSWTACALRSSFTRPPLA